MTNKCPQCGASLPARALEGLCPACLLAEGAAAETASQGGAPFDPPGVEELARLFPQLEILAFIGKGGMGAVYKARQPALDRLVALKILPPQTAGDPGFAGRFNREARALAKLSHPNIVALHEFGQVDGLPFFIMEFVDGLNLRQLERAGKLSPREALQIVPQICEALQFAHDEGIVHRDIKPENILLDKKGRVKIADFGIAKIVGAGGNPLTPSLSPTGGEGGRRPGERDAPAFTEAGKTIGTPNYMAPEQVDRPQAVDHRADIYSLGVVFYEMLTGELPLGKFAPPSRKVTVDVRLDEVVLRALEKKPEHRYQHASQVRTAVETIAGMPATPPVSAVRSHRAGVLALAVVLLGVAGMAAFFHGRNGSPNASAEKWVPPPGAKPDPSKVLQVAQQLAADGEYEESLQRLIWYYNHALEYDPGQSGVRLSFALSDWFELGRKYPKAMQVLIGTRDSAAGKFATNAGTFQSFMEVAAINRYLKDDDATLALFKSIFKKDPALGHQCYFAVEDLLVQKAEYELCLQGMRDPEARFDLNKSSWDYYQSKGLSPPKDETNRFVTKSCQLIEILLAAGHKSEAEKIRAQAMAVVDDARLKSAILDAEERIRAKQAPDAAEVARPLSQATAVVETSSSASKLQFRLVAEGDEASAEDLPMASDSAKKGRLRVMRAVLADGSIVKRAGFEIAPAGQEQIYFELTPVGKQLFADLTSRNIGRQLAIVWEGSVVSAPVIRSPIEGDSGLISMSSNKALAEQIVAALNHRPDLPSDLQFGPEFEAVLPFQHGPGDVFLDLKDNRLLTNSFDDHSSREFYDWLRNNGADIASTPENPFPVLNAFGIVTARVPGSDWTEATAFEVEYNWNLMNDEPKPRTSLTSGTNQSTFVWFFRTRENVSGVLRITGFSDDPRGVKIRYKLVQAPSAGRVAAISDTAKPRAENPEVLRLKLAAAEQRFQEVQKQVENGMVSPIEAEKAKFERDTLAAELKGDDLEVARLKLQFAEVELSNAARRKATGIIPASEYDKFKLARDIAAAEANSVSNAMASEPFSLRFLAWQDEWKTNPVGAVRLPDGSKVTSAEELGWLPQVAGAGVDTSESSPAPETRSLHLWFSYPASARPELNEISLLDDAGQRIDLGGRTSINTATVDANDRNGNFDWLIFTVSPGKGLYFTRRIAVQLRYTAGALEQVQEVAGDFKGGMSLEDGSQLNEVGQNSRGRASVALTVDAKLEASRRFSVLAVDKSGREISAVEWGVGTKPGSGVLMENFDFEIPLKDVAKFRIGTRPIRTKEWKNVVLPRE